MTPKEVRDSDIAICNSLIETGRAMGEDTGLLELARNEMVRRLKDLAQPVPEGDGHE